MEGENNIRRTPRKRELASCDDVAANGRTTRNMYITDSPKPSPDKYHNNRQRDNSLSPRKAVLGAKLKLQDITDILNSDSEYDADKSPAKRRQATSIKRKIFTNSPAKNSSPKTKNQAYILKEQNDSILNLPVQNLLKQVKVVTAALRDKTETLEKTLGSANKLQQLSNSTDAYGCAVDRQVSTVSPIKRQNLLNKFSSPSKLTNDLEENDNLTRSVGNPASNCKLTMNNEEESEKYQIQTSVAKRRSTMRESVFNATPNKVNPPSAPRSTRTRRKIDLTPVKSKSPAIVLKQQHKDEYNSTPKKRERKRKINYNENDDDEEINEIELPEETPENASSPLKLAMSRLHVSSIPKRLPCREAEFNNVYCFVKGKLIDNIGGCMYISGVPGTGKTATVRSVIKELQSEVPKMDVPKFQFIEINGLQLTEPRQAYVQILKHMNGRKATSEQAQQLLEDMFTKSKAKTPSTIILVDELDMLCTRRQDVIYNMLDWPSKAKTCLIVITIANTMDLPERLLMGRVTSRLGLTRLTFQPYTFKQLEEIVKARLCGIQAFDADAIQFVARKVAAVSGDARRALNICRRATEIAEYSTNNSDIVLMKHVDQALLEMFTSPVVQIIKNLSKLEQLLLCAVAAIVQRTGIEKCSFKRVYEYFRTLAIFDGITVPSSTRTLSIVAKLGNYRLLLTEHSQLDITQHVMLNISSDDLHFALQNSLEKN